MSIFSLSYVRNIALACIASLSVVSCSWPLGVGNESLVDAPYILLVYPFTEQSAIIGKGLEKIFFCLEVGCSDLMLVNGSGDVSRMDIRGVMEERVAFSNDGRRVVFTADGGIVHIANGVKGSVVHELFSPVVRYLSVEDGGNILYIDHQPIDDKNDEFSSVIYRKSGLDEYISKTNMDAVFRRCGNSLHAFSFGRYDKSKNALHYPEYIYEGDGRFREIRYGQNYGREILGYECSQDGLMTYLALVDGSINIGIYGIEYGFKDDNIKYSWDEFASPSEEEPIIVEEDSVWALTTLGEMRVFDRRSPKYRVAWDMYRYFEKVSVSDIAATSIQRDGSVFFFGIPKGKETGWVMIEVEVKSGEVIRAVQLPNFDELYPKGHVQGIYMGDVDGFRKWADTQPKFDYTAMH